MDLKELNKNNLTVTDVITHFGKLLKQNHDIDLSQNKLKNLFIEAVIRNMVMNEIEDMMLFIADEEKYNQMMEARS